MSTRAAHFNSVVLFVHKNMHKYISEKPKITHQEKEKALQKKTCCFNCGLTIYILLCIIGFVTLLAIGIVSGTYSDKLTSFNTLDAVRDQGDKWLDILEQQVRTTFRLGSLISRNPILRHHTHNGATSSR